MTDYTPTGKPEDDKRLIAKQLRDEFALIQAALNSKQDENMLVIGGTEAQGATVNDYVITVTPAITSYTTSSLILFKATHTNTGAATLKVSALSAVALKSVSGAALVAGDLVIDSWYMAVYNGTDCRLIAITKNYVDQLAFSAALPSQTGNSGKFVTTDGTNASWATISSGLVRSARTSNTILASGDSGKLIDITSGTFTQTFTAATTLGSGWYCYIRNSGTGFVTLDPNGTETINRNGVAHATWVLWPEEACLIVCDGTGFHYINLQTGRISQTISTPVTSVAFSTGLAYRAKLALAIEDIATGTASDLLLRVNSIDSNSALHISASGNTLSSGSLSSARLTGARGVFANATGTDRLHASCIFDVGSVNTELVSNAAFRDSLSAGSHSILNAIFQVTSTSITNIALLHYTGATLTAGTLTLQEL